MTSRTAEFYSECSLARGVSQDCKAEERSRILKEHGCPQYAVRSERIVYEEQTFWGRLFRRDPKLVVKTVIKASCTYALGKKVIS